MIPFNIGKNSSFPLLSVSGRLEVIDEPVDVIVVTDGGLGGYSPVATCATCATQASGSIGLTGSVRGIVKYPLGLESQHLATTSFTGPGLCTTSLRNRTYYI